jgi:hypothetical protein
MPSGRRDAVIDEAYQGGRDDASQEGRQHRACREEGSRDVVACWTLMHRGILESKPARNLIGDWWQRAGRKVIGRKSRCGNRKEEAQEAPRRVTWVSRVDLEMSRRRISRLGHQSSARGPSSRALACRSGLGLVVESEVIVWVELIVGRNALGRGGDILHGRRTRE